MAWGEMAVVSPLGALADPIVQPSLDRPGRFTIVDDMGDRLVRSWEGELWVDDASTGAVLGVLPTIGYATHPSINADGDRLVYSSCVSGDGWEWNMQGCELRALEADEAGDWTVDRELLGRDPTWNYYYPTISPDGQWVLFNRSTGNTHDDEDAELMLLPLALEGDPSTPRPRQRGTGEDELLAAVGAGLCRSRVDQLLESPAPGRQSGNAAGVARRGRPRPRMVRLRPQPRRGPPSRPGSRGRQPHARVGPPRGWPLTPPEPRRCQTLLSSSSTASATSW